MSISGDILLSTAKQKYNWQRVESVFKEKNYSFFTKPYDMNIFGIRNSIDTGGKFDDVIGVAWRSDFGVETVKWFQCTTDPSDQYLLKPLNPKGTIAIVPGQYRQVYQIGIHGRTWSSGGYEALEQVGKIKYIRDNNKDNVLDMDNPEFWGIHKTNIHRASKWNVLDKVGPYSAGCQVIQDPKDFRLFMQLAKLQNEKLGFDKFTYTLFDLDDFRL